MIRIQGILTIAGVLVVLFAWLMIMLRPGDGSPLQKWITVHGEHPLLVVFDLLPVWLWLFMEVFRRQTARIIERFRSGQTEAEQLLQQNTDFAMELSEGEDPSMPPEMLESELGQALRLIQLNIKSNRRKEKEMTWIAEGKDMVSRILRLYSDLDELSYRILRGLNSYIDATQGAMYLWNEEREELVNISTFAYNRRKYVDQVFGIGQGLVGQCAYEMDYIYRTEIPEDYVSITSGILGDQKPQSILLVPLITNQQLQGIMEFAFLEPRVPKLTIQFLLELGEIIARTIYNLQVNERTRRLLEESRKMTEELQRNEAILQESAEEMRVTQDQLKQSNTQLEEKMEEAQHARNRLHWLLENASEIISIYDASYRLTYVSPSVTRILGYTPEEMMAGKDFERISREGSTEIKKALDQLREQPDQARTLEYSFVKKDGTRLFLQTGVSNHLEDPSIGGFIFNTRDITESRRAEKEQRLKTRMQSLSENSLDLILRVSITGIVHYANPVVEDYAGIPAGTMVNQPISDIPFQQVVTDFISQALHAMREQPRKINQQVTLPQQLGEKTTERILRFDAIPEFQDGELETILFVGHDITEAKRIEQEIKVTNRKIQDSITYAERIQSSILPGAERIRKAFPRSFVYYQPRDVISGDFPWFMETGDARYIAAIDCTGHGVPGALLSFIGFFLLNNITSLNPDAPPGQLLDELHRAVRETLRQDRRKPDTRDGMDLALCKIYRKQQRMEFAGAHRPLYLLRDGELNIFKGERKAIGGIIHPRKPEKPFETHEIPLMRGDKIFFFSDGLTDQLGGPDESKYSPARVRETLLEYPGYTMPQFRDHFKKDFAEWMGDQRQLDDVLLIGIEF